jgi:hypothetical protein
MSVLITLALIVERAWRRAAPDRGGLDRAASAPAPVH